MPKKLLVLLLPVLLLNSCAMGVLKLKPRYPYELNFTGADKTDEQAIVKEIKPGIKLTVNWIGNAPPLVTAKNMLGLSYRFVIPYTRETTLLQLKVENNSDETIELAPRDFYLGFDHQKQAVLELDFFKARWPSSPIRTQEVMLDRSMALGEVTRTIFRQRKIRAGESYQAYLAFLRVPETTEFVRLGGDIRSGEQNLEFDFSFEKHEKN